MKFKIPLLILTFFALNLSAQLPTNTLVGYHENWYNIKLSKIHENYNVVCLAFAVAQNGSTSDMKYDIPAGYTGSVTQKKNEFMADIDALHVEGKRVILSIGGATSPISLTNDTERDEFIATINGILAEYSYKMDGIDLDFEGSSLSFGSTWTINSPAAGQTRVVDAVKSIMSNYKIQTGKKMLLLMAPEVLYVQGGLSSWGVSNANGGAYLPIIDGLRNELDLLSVQLYNTGGANGGAFAWNGSIYYDGTPEFPLAMTETLIKGFTCVGGKGTFTGLPASKLTFAFPASTANNAAGTGYLGTTDVCNTAKYFKGEITKPGGYNYTMSTSYPDLRGLMTWSINEDSYATSGVYSFADNYPCAFPLNITSVLTVDEAIGVGYPNPFIDVFRWSGAAVNCIIHDNKGAVVYNGKLNESQAVGENWKAGVYFIQILDQEVVQHIKMIKI
jgi:chitinase